MGERRNSEVLFNGHKISVWHDDYVLKMNSGDGCTALSMHITIMECTLKSS